MSLALNDKVNRQLVAQLPAGVPAQIPPACLLDMQGEFLEYMEGESLRVRFPVLARYANPLGHMQGGFIAAALDNTLGPFSYLIAPPSATVSLNLQYLRPVTPGETHIECHARLLERTRNTLHLAGEALLGDGRRAAVCQAICQILPTPG
ncbi:PaaI family thioesterase [Pseudoxanthomonas kalamensis]|uniref:PaaI family thioesterase n=1 Tax=Pseudoxanthomonas kalamensis TaxID=289483 RepID=UPI001392019F|nr:PaaI family thioesterase [Pseudoxanthomonas kalamensis]